MFGVFLFVVALVLRIFAPIASLLVQAAVSRQREYLADATSVELTRNPTALARALGALEADRDPLDLANRGSQHLWFTNPVSVARLEGARLATGWPRTRHSTRASRASASSTRSWRRRSEAEGPTRTKGSRADV